MSFRSGTSRFARNMDGNVAMMFGLTLFPLLLVTGAAVDYARGSAEKTRLQQALDATALAVAREPKSASQADLQRMADQYFAAAFASREGAPPAVQVAKAGETITVTSRTSVPVTLMGLVGQPDMVVNAATTVSFTPRQIEIALVLDNTGSMGLNGKMAALKTAATNFIDQLAVNQPQVGDVQVSLVPYATQVNVGASNVTASWLDASSVNPWTWTGCVQDRVQDFDVNADPGAKYPATTCAWATSRMTPLVDLSNGANVASVKARIAAMEPSGNTNITIGLAWGLATISPLGPFPGARTFGLRNVEKFVVLLTDGDNTQSRYSTNKFALDQRMRMACDAVKDPAKKVRLFTIRVVDGDAALLRNCASSPGDYYEAADATQIQPAFTAILRNILDLRMTN